MIQVCKPYIDDKSLQLDQEGMELINDILATEPQLLEKLFSPGVKGSPPPAMIAEAAREMRLHNSDTRDEDVEMLSTSQSTEQPAVAITPGVGNTVTVCFVGNVTRRMNLWDRPLDKPVVFEIIGLVQSEVPPGPFKRALMWTLQNPNPENGRFGIAIKDSTHADVHLGSSNSAYANCRS